MPSPEDFNALLDEASARTIEAVTGMVPCDPGVKDQKVLALAVPMGVLVAAARLLNSQFTNPVSVETEEMAIALLRSAIRGVSDPMNRDDLDRPAERYDA